jgi:hypothetical protein
MYCEKKLDQLPIKGGDDGKIENSFFSVLCLPHDNG